MTTLPPTDWIHAAAGRTPDAVAMIDDRGRETTYAELHAAVDGIAGGLTRVLGLHPFARLGVAADIAPRREVAAMLAGVNRAGLVAVPVAVRNVPGEVVLDLRRRLDLADIVTRVDASPFGHPDVVPAPDDVHSIVLTSGSAAEPRGVLLTHRNVAAAVTASRRHLGNTAGDRWLLVLPLHHVGGLAVLWRSAQAGGTVIVHERFDPPAVAAALKEGVATFASLVPAMLSRVLAADPGPYPAAQVLIGGGPLDVALAERALDSGLRVLATYGMTETCSQAATVVPGEERDSLGTAGRPLPGFDVTIVDERGNAVAPGRSGSIAVAGPAVSPGYVGSDPRRGILVTPDRGRFDGAGRLVVEGRSDDAISTGGETVRPARVESVLEGHPAVVEAAVFGVPDATWGEIVAAAYVAAEEIAEIELTHYARERLTGHEIPRRWIRVGEIPRIGPGKVDRRALRRLATRTDPE